MAQTMLNVLVLIMAVTMLNELLAFKWDVVRESLMAGISS